MYANPIESLRTIRQRQKNSGKDVLGYTGIVTLCVAEVVRTDCQYFIPAAVAAGVMSITSCIAYDGYTRAGDILEHKIIEDLTR